MFAYYMYVNMTLDYSKCIDDVVILNEKEIEKYDDVGDVV